LKGKKELSYGLEPCRKAGHEKPNPTQSNAGKVLDSAANLHFHILFYMPARSEPKRCGPDQP